MLKSVRTVNYSSLNKRITAASIDLFILLIMLMPLMDFISNLVFGDRHIGALLNELHEQTNDESLVTGTMILKKLWEEQFFQKYLLVQFISIVMMSIYIIGFWISCGTTPGKWACACKIVDDKTFNKLSYKQAIVRCLSYIISGIPFGLGFIMIGFTEDKKGLHDKISGTAVIDFKHDFSRFERIRNKILKKY